MLKFIKTRRRCAEKFVNLYCETRLTHPAASPAALRHLLEWHLMQLRQVSEKDQASERACPQKASEA